MTGPFMLIARRDIFAGEELTADYCMWETREDYVSKWECRCETAKCRHRITGSDWKLPELQSAYRGHFIPLINKRIDSLS
jgi:hypothetical protein